MKSLFRQTIEKARQVLHPRQAPRPGGAFPGRAKTKLPVKKSYAAVTIRPGLIACAAVSGHRNRRMLEKDAPTIPVPGCDEKNCQCQFIKHTDRRVDDDRRTPFGRSIATKVLGNQYEQRDEDDRRASKKRARARAYFNDYQ